MLRRYCKDVKGKVNKIKTGGKERGAGLAFVRQKSRSAALIELRLALRFWRRHADSLGLSVDIVQDEAIDLMRARGWHDDLRFAVEVAWADVVIPVHVEEPYQGTLTWACV